MSSSRLRSFRTTISRKGADLGHMLLLNINRKASMGCPLVRLHGILVILKGQFTRISNTSRKGAELAHVLRIKHQWEITYG